MPRPRANIAGKHPVATGLTSQQLALLDREAKERALFSARTTEQRYVAAMQDVLEDLVAGDIDLAGARKRLKGILDDFGYTPEHGFPDAEAVEAAKPGTIEDLSSFGRLNLVMDTNEGMAASVSRLAEETDETLDLFPAWRLVRFMEPNGEPRDWALRWAVAGEEVNWEGACREEMVARKDSPIWQALGDGAGGFTDTLGNPYPPFAFNSGMGWEDVDRDEAEALGLELDEPVRIERPSLGVSEEEVDLAREHYGDTFANLLLGEYGMANEITHPCPVCKHQLRADGGCTHCERTELLRGALKPISKTEAYKVLAEPVVVKNGETSFRFTKEKLLSRSGHIFGHHGHADARRRTRVLLYAMDAARTSKDVVNKRASEPNALGVYPQRKEISKTYTDRKTCKPFKVFVIADDAGEVYEVFDIYPS